MVVLSVCSLPDPKEVDYDHLFVRLMSALDLFVENDYIVILFASAGRHRPGWNWLWKAYKGLTRNYRKNLKRLYIVHPTLFTKTLVQFISTGSYFISPKFARKIVQCSTLAELGQHVPLQQIELPPEVLTHDLALTKGEEAKASFSTQEAGALDATKKVFGVPLEHLMGESGEYWSIPRVVKDSIEFLRHPLPGSEDTGELLMDTEGIFRRSPPSSLLRAAQMAYDGGHPVNLERYGDGPASAAHLAASLLKTFLRRLPSPLFPPSLYPLVKACPLHDPGENLADLEDTLEYIRSRLLPALAPPCKITLLATVCELLHDVAQRSQRNKMDAANLATVIAPNLVRGSDPLRDVAMCRVEGIGSMHSTVSNSGGKPQGPRPATLSRGATSTPDSNATDVKGPAGGDRTLGTVLRICVEHAYEIFPAAPVEPPMNTSYSDSIDGIISGAVTPAQPSSPSVTRNSARLPPLSTSVSTWTDSSASEGRPSSEHALLGLGLSAQTNGHSQKMSASQGDANVSPAGASEARGWARPRSGSASQPAGRASVEQSTRSAEPAQHEAGVHPSSTAARGASIRSVGGARSGEGGSYRGAGGGFGALGKSSAGSLRLTKGRLGSIGSGSSLRGASTLAATGAHANSIFAQGSPLGKTVQGDHAITPPMATGMVRYASTGSEGLTSSPSGVSLSGANASGLFSNSSASNSTLSSPVAKKGSSPAAHSATAVDDRSPLSARTSTPRTSASPSIMVGSTMDADVQPSLMTDATTTPLNSSIANTNRAPSAPGLSAGQPISRHLSASGGGRPLSEVVEHDDDHLE
ncbi:hypothetical protein IE81DRAFT_190424 [Ceraceosorus guamensis]|uniref:Rho-GAP domain-containing protein n=1 Tax=Ceraceosorus guamensis TaxID=1522189 RepID=A0A316W634_9BASI|nr:hypothetical protein IE81DRAFT_190424 [Ceraceosorus guamensis]PWN45420.1 hypothetical protein IE81DRAFT_190424 [Ceraceosorus guamensis]